MGNHVFMLLGVAWGGWGVLRRLLRRLILGKFSDGGGRRWFFVFFLILDVYILCNLNDINNQSSYSTMKKSSFFPLWLDLLFAWTFIFYLYSIFSVFPSFSTSSFLSTFSLLFSLIISLPSFPSFTSLLSFP